MFRIVLQCLKHVASFVFIFLALSVFKNIQIVEQSFPCLRSNWLCYLQNVCLKLKNKLFTDLLWVKIRVHLKHFSNHEPKASSRQKRLKGVIARKNVQVNVIKVCPCATDRIGIWKRWFLRKGYNRSFRKTFPAARSKTNDKLDRYGVEGANWRAKLVGRQVPEKIAVRISSLS